MHDTLAHNLKALTQDISVDMVMYAGVVTPVFADLVVHHSFEFMTNFCLKLVLAHYTHLSYMKMQVQCPSNADPVECVN